MDVLFFYADKLMFFFFYADEVDLEKCGVDVGVIDFAVLLGVSIQLHCLNC
jgi:hypothetical protein